MADDPGDRENGAARLSSNYLLDRVPPDERARMDDRLKPVLLEAGQVLYEPGQPLTHVFLPLTGMISLVAVMSDGRTAEGMTIGREGAAGLSASGYVDDAFNRYVVQLPGSGYRVKAEDFEDLVNESVAFCSAVTRWREVMVRMSLQSVACNALHTVRQRLARWILTTHDRTETDRLPLKQEFLAEMLGVKRNAVNIVAREFLSTGAIEYKRGKISVINPDLLREESCECYALIRGEISKLFTQPPSSECED
ncbi:Crp/Fnr family transcriptional regulator [Sphingomonas sp. TX0543]|uniref:CRP-like cAMP-binding protein n=1 Tax=Sphingomonas aquatilis TaxID=93063 RepID=A0AAW3TUQ8_9SPHN|nr:Crp/Fnr family transcriptional regulator [Sphingomonas aquatilis]MBB3877453.1 CRP-like cAMP-binding protein [Sphingomonas aquatilis]GEM72890.1 Crp/Fnr family transcriptional regulator [Sphingomonas aquatilis NBRC 16722]